MPGAATERIPEEGDAAGSVPIVLSRKTLKGRSRRFNSDEDYRSLVPVHVVWEITLACNLKCSTAALVPASAVPTSCRPRDASMSSTSWRG